MHFSFKKFGHAGYALAFNDMLVPSMSPPIKMGPTSKLRSLNAAYTQFSNLKNTKKHIFCIFPLKNLRIWIFCSTFAPAFETKHGPLAQLNRVPHYGCGGCRFESCTDHKATSNRGFFVCIYPQTKQEKGKGILKMGSTWIRHGFGNH